MFTYLVQTVNNMYQIVSGKSIENQELILRVFLLCVDGARDPDQMSLMSIPSASSSSS